MRVYGIPIIESEFCTVDKQRIIKRTWRERLLSWPWKPTQGTKVVTVQVANPNLFFMADKGVFIGHPTTVAKLADMIDSLDSPLVKGQ